MVHDVPKKESLETEKMKRKEGRKGTWAQKETEKINTPRRKKQCLVGGK